MDVAAGRQTRHGDSTLANRSLRGGVDFVVTGQAYGWVSGGNDRPGSAGAVEAAAGRLTSI